MKKSIYCILALIMYLFTACSKNDTSTVYTYPDKQEVLSCSVEKTEVYSDRMIVYFSGDVFDSAESVTTYASDFSVINDEADFSFSDSILTITDIEPDMISGLKIDVNESEYYNIRYLDSDSYAMLRYNWAEDYGFIESGDTDAYYTDEEKQRFAERAAKYKADYDHAFSLIKGVWEDDSHSTRLEIGTVQSEFDGSELNVADLFEFTDSAWMMTERIFIDTISADENSEPVQIYVTEERALTYGYDFTLYNDMTELECTLTDARLKRIE